MGKVLQIVIHGAVVVAEILVVGAIGLDNDLGELALLVDGIVVRLNEHIGIVFHECLVEDFLFRLVERKVLTRRKGVGFGDFLRIDIQFSNDRTVAEQGVLHIGDFRLIGRGFTRGECQRKGGNGKAERF